jgi:hypothetical protein
VAGRLHGHLTTSTGSHITIWEDVNYIEVKATLELGTYPGKGSQSHALDLEIDNAKIKQECKYT